MRRFAAFVRSGSAPGGYFFILPILIRTGAGGGVCLHSLQTFRSTAPAGPRGACIILDARRTRLYTYAENLRARLFGFARFHLVIEMHEQFANDFYRSVAWQKCRCAFISARGGLCERCLARGLYSAGECVHHKIHLTPENLTNPSITLGFDNLELLCRNCHAEVHREKSFTRRFSVDASGTVFVSAEK